MSWIEQFAVNDRETFLTSWSVYKVFNNITWNNTDKHHPYVQQMYIFHLSLSHPKPWEININLFLNIPLTARGLISTWWIVLLSGPTILTSISKKEQI